MSFTTVAAVLRALNAEPGRPRLTWYGPDGERVELSGAVLENWVAKTGNLLVEELDAGPGTRVLLDLPAHWRTVLWAFAAWRVGACVVLRGDAGAAGADVVVTDRPGEHPGAEPLVAVSLGALARRFDGDLPAGAIDAAAAVMTYGDVLGWVPAADPAAPALLTDAGDVPHRTLPAWAAGAADVGPGARVLVPTATGSARTLAVEHLLRVTCDVLGAGGSVVVLDATTSEAVAGDGARRARLVDGERVSDEVPAPVA
ncbi:TIGR03089 family protein [Cellulomonas sp. NS3]|uniref:TIGR03089 family protein n=1 Tax=Cellulomonas sp. NS3 TaxID=2973977 RepID=UPI0021635FB2|nr:TIGR03089 family protein [Cellulomonas sp. NS3]